MKQEGTKFSALDPPEYVGDLWSRWLTSRCFTGSIREKEQAYLESTEYDSWSDYLAHFGYYGHFNEQKRNFWNDFADAYRRPPTKLERAVHYFVGSGANWVLISDDLPQYREGRNSQLYDHSNQAVPGQSAIKIFTDFTSAVLTSSLAFNQIPSMRIIRRSSLPQHGDFPDTHHCAK